MSQWKDMICEQDLNFLTESKSHFKKRQLFHHQVRRSSIVTIHPRSNVFKDQGDHYSLRVSFGDSGLNISIIVDTVEEGSYKKFEKFYGTMQEFPPIMKYHFPTLQEIYQQFFGAKYYTINLSGQIIYQYQTVILYQKSILDEVICEQQILQLTQVSLSMQERLQTTINKLKQTKKQLENIKKEKGQIKDKAQWKIQMDSHKQFIPQIRGAEGNDQKDEENRREVKLRLFNQGIHLSSSSVGNMHHDWVMISPLLTVYQDALEIIILNNPKQLTVGVMHSDDLISHKIVSENGERLPKQFVAFSSKKVRNQKKTYCYQSYSFHNNSRITFKLEKKNILFGVDDQKILHFSRKSMVPFIQLGQGCQIDFKNCSLKKSQ